jgi:hypothetical protein
VRAPARARCVLMCAGVAGGLTWFVLAACRPLFVLAVKQILPDLQALLYDGA